MRRLRAVQVLQVQILRFKIRVVHHEGLDRGVARALDFFLLSTFAKVLLMQWTPLTAAVVAPEMPVADGGNVCLAYVAHDCVAFHAGDLVAAVHLHHPHLAARACPDQRFRHCLLDSPAMRESAVLSGLLAGFWDVRLGLAQPATDLFAVRVVAPELLILFDRGTNGLEVAERALGQSFQSGFGYFVHLLQVVQSAEQLLTNGQLERLPVEARRAAVDVETNYFVLHHPDLRLCGPFDTCITEWMHLVRAAGDRAIDRHVREATLALDQRAQLPMKLLILFLRLLQRPEA